MCHLFPSLNIVMPIYVTYSCFIIFFSYFILQPDKLAMTVAPFTDVIRQTSKHCHSFISLHASHAIACFTKSGILFHLYSICAWVSLSGPSRVQTINFKMMKTKSIHTGVPFTQMLCLYELMALQWLSCMKWNNHLKFIHMRLLYLFLCLLSPIFCFLFTSFPF